MLSRFRTFISNKLCAILIFLGLSFLSVTLLVNAYLERQQKKVEIMLSVLNQHSAGSKVYEKTFYILFDAGYTLEEICVFLYDQYSYADWKEKK